MLRSPISAAPLGRTAPVAFAMLLLLTIADPTQAQTLSASLQASQYNGYNVSCFGGKDGAIDLTVSGGQSPYTYSWSTSATTEDISDLSKGYYSVTVTDAASNRVTKEITLTEPEVLGVQLDPHVYGNDFNISCFNCYNGSINATVTGGVASYTFSWNDGPTTEDRTGLGSGNYLLAVTDANGCSTESEHLYLTEPGRDDWTMSGNVGTTPGVDYVGTADSTDLVFKTYGSERLRLLGNGDIRASSLAFDEGYRIIFADSTGALKSLSRDDYFAKPCPSTIPWLLCGNNIKLPQFLGTTNAKPLIIKTDGVERMRITEDGKVQIGDVDVSMSTYDYGLYVEKGILTEKVKVAVATSDDWEDRVFTPDYVLLPLDSVACFVEANGHLPWVPSAEEMAQQGLDVASMDAMLMRKIEELTLYLISLQREVVLIREQNQQLRSVSIKHD